MFTHALVRLVSRATFTRLEIARIINRHEAYLKPFLKEMVKKGILSYTIPEMSNNPHQAYKTIRMPHEDAKQGLLEL